MIFRSYYYFNSLQTCSSPIKSPSYLDIKRAFIINCKYSFENCKISFKFLKVTQFDHSRGTTWRQMWSGHVLWLSLRLTQKIELRIFMCKSLENSRGSLFHDRHTTLPVAHMGKLPHHTVKMLPDGLHILLTGWLCGYGLTGWRPLKYFHCDCSWCSLGAHKKEKPASKSSATQL